MHQSLRIKSAQTSILAKHARIDILINNAGITCFLETSGPHVLEHLDFASWRKVNEVNLDGVVLGYQAAIKLMKQSRNASIVNISSRSGIVSIPAAAAYAALYLASNESKYVTGIELNIDGGILAGSAAAPHQDA